VLKQATSLVGVPLLRNMAVSSQLSRYASSIEFCGDATSNAIQAIGTVQQSVSRCAVERFSVIDRRAGPTDGCGVYFEKVVNQTVIRNMDIHGFPSGASIRVTAQSGNTSDCVTIDDIWALGSQYGVDISNIDNTCLIRDIKIDSASTQPLLAGIRVGALNAVCVITGVKHENSKATASTVQLDVNSLGVIIDGVISRIGVNGGPVVTLSAGNVGSGVTIRNLKRQFSGVLLASGANTITGTRLPFWVGGSDGIHLGGARVATQYDIWGLLSLEGSVRVGTAPPGGRVGFYGASPVARPSLTYSRTEESTAQTQIRAALSALGLVTDSTVP